MKDSTRVEFAEFITTGCSKLLGEIARAASVPLIVLDDRGDLLLSTHSSGTGELFSATGRIDRMASDTTEPIEIDGDTVGCLVAVIKDEDPGDLIPTLAAELARRFSTERDLDHMTDRLGESYEEINLLYRFTRVLKPEENFSSMAQKLLQQTTDLLERRFLVLYLPEWDRFEWSKGDQHTNSLTLNWLAENDNSLQEVYRRFIDAAPAKASLEATRHPGTMSTPQGRVVYVVAPVRTPARVIGFVGLFRTSDDVCFETGELRLLGCLAEELSNTATTEELNLELRQMLFNTVRSLVAAIDAKDVYTRGHSERVYRLSMLIGERLGLAPDQMQTLSWAAVLHDVGKIAIKGNILNKPGRLTDEEFAEVKTHPAKGCKVIEPIPQLQAALPGIRHHHERFDGKGYPDGLKGEEIPFQARIIAVADTYDAIVSTRAYRQAKTNNWAIDEINRCSGTQFDPEAAGAFMELAAEGLVDDPSLDELDNEEAA